MKKDPTTAICPITFMGKDILSEASVNSLFTNPYDTKINTDILNSMMLDSIKSQTKNLKDDKYQEWVRYVSNINNAANIESIMSYLRTNISELCRQTIIRFLADTFTPRNISDTEKYVNITESEYISKMLPKINIDEIVNDIVINTQYLLPYKNLTAQQIYMAADMTMNIIYTELVASLFNAFIVEHLNLAMNNGVLDQLYELLYAECYGEPEDHNIKIPGVDVEYTFCSSILREKMEYVLTDFRKALMMVAKTLSCMIINSSDFINHGDDINYTTSDFLKDNAYLSDQVAMKGIDSDD